MNKKIKVIDLLNMIAKGEELPNKIRFHKLTYTKKTLKFVPTLASEADIDFIEYIRARSLNEEVEIIEEQEEIDIQEIEEIKAQDIGGTFLIDDKSIKINKLIKAVKYLDNKIKEIEDEN